MNTASSIGSGSFAVEVFFLLWGEGAEQPAAVGQLEFGAVAEARLGPERQEAARRVPAELAEADDHPHLVQQRQLLGRVRQACIALGGRGLVGRRSAPNRGAHERAVE